MKTCPQTLRGEPLAENVRAILNERIRSKGVGEVSRLTRLSRNALMRALAGLPVLLGTGAALREWAASAPATEGHTPPEGGFAVGVHQQSA